LFDRGIGVLVDERVETLEAVLVDEQHFVGDGEQ
jgi:hypothetical protein